MPARLTAWMLALVTLLVPAAIGWSAEVDPDLAYARQTLSEAGIATDGATLLKFFRQRTPSAAELSRLAQTVRLLGSPDFRTRIAAYKALQGAGRAVLASLRKAASDPDPEIARSAERLCKQIEDGREKALTIAAARVLADSRAAGATRALLAYLPMAGDELLQEALLEALVAVGLKDGRAADALVAAVTDAEPTRRAAAALVLSKATKDQQQVVHKLLKDADPGVRFRAAAGLGQAGERSAVATLIALLDEGSPELTWQCEDLLCRLAADGAPVPPAGADKAARHRYRLAWEAWWKANSARANLARLRGEGALRGLTVICEVDGSGKDNQGRVWECGLDGKVRWEMDNGMGSPVDVQVLPGRRLLVSEYGKGRVTERDQQGKILWEKKCTGSVLSGQRLPNGNTFIASMTELLEVDRTGRTVFSLKKSTYFAQKIRNGHILYVDSANNVAELDAAGKQLWSIQLAGSAWGSVEKLSPGRYLVCLYSGGRVVEVDATGKVLWQCTMQNPTYATRLRNGRILVSGDRMVAEFDRTGRVVWKQQTRGRAWRVRRY
jgi:hypothetical protein